jgi:uncharacterized protein (TIGR02246 family)
MTDRDAVDAWVDRYVAAWQSNDPDDIGALFADDARYFTEPFRDPWVGRDAIVEGWLAIRDEPGTWTFRHETLAVADGAAFVRGRTTYESPEREYSNLWVIELDGDGRAREFTEWWMRHE